MVPGSTLMYGSSLTMAILRPRPSRMAPSEAAAMPFPNEETTPPVTNTNLVMRSPPSGETGDARCAYRRAGRLTKGTSTRFPFQQCTYPAQARATPGFDSGGDGRVDPAVARGDRVCSSANSSGMRARSSTGILAACSSFLSVCVRARAPGAVVRRRAARALRGAGQAREVDGPGRIVDELERARRSRIRRRSVCQRHDFATNSLHGFA